MYRVSRKLVRLNKETILSNLPTTCVRENKAHANNITGTTLLLQTQMPTEREIHMELKIVYKCFSSTERG